MSFCVKKSNMPKTRSGYHFLSFQAVIRIEKAIEHLSPDILRFNQQKLKEFRAKCWVIPTYRKNLNIKEEKELLNISFKQIHWLDYVGK